MIASKAIARSAVLLTASLAFNIALAGEHKSKFKHDKHKHHQSAHHKKHVDNHKKAIKIALWGDEFYSNDVEEKSNLIEQTLSSMNQRDLDFTIFVGDSKNGSSACTDEAIGSDIVSIFNSLKAPTLYSVGDNEWTDCHRTNNGSYDPIERLAFLRNTFFSKAKTQGVHPLKVERQGALGDAYSENSRLIKNDVVFVALHIPGSNNNLVANDSQCFKKSDRTQADCDAASAEYSARNIKNIEWLMDSFAKANEKDAAGILIAIQADIFFPFELSDGRYQEQFLPQLDENNGYSDFFHKLVEETKSFSGKVLLVHGDSHYFKIDKPMFNSDGRLTANFMRVEVFGNEDNSWVELTVDPSTENVFSLEPVVLN